MGDSFRMREYFSNIYTGLLSFWEGLSLTFKHMKNKEDLVATLQYPNEKWPIPERNIGFDNSEYNVIRSRLHVDMDDCIGCLQCERACPVDCIKIDVIKPPKESDFDCGKTSHDTQKKMIVPRFTIDMSECMYCNLCVYPCPEECIYMVGGPNEEKQAIDYEFSQYERKGLIFEFANSTDQDIVSAGGEEYLKQRNAKKENLNKGKILQGKILEKEVTLKEVRKSLKKRNELDTKRRFSSLKIVDDAVLIRTDILSKLEMIDKMSKEIRKKINSKKK